MKASDEMQAQESELHKNIGAEERTHQELVKKLN